MGRIRSIHPGIYSDEAWASVSIAARWLGMGLCTEADDNGVFEWKPLQIKMRLFPADNVAIDELLSELYEAEIVQRYQVGEKQYGAIRNFCRYQRPRKPQSKHPLNDDTADFVALKEREVPQKSEPDGLEDKPVPQKSEKSPQMEDGGGSRGRKEETVAQHIPRAKEKGNRTKAWFDELESALREAAGLENDPSPTLLDISPMVALLDKGYDLATDILPKLRAAKARNKRGSSWAYYVPAITEGKAANGSIAPKATETKGPPQIWVTEEDPRWRPLADKWKSVKGHDPPVRGSRYEPGQGHHFPAEWVGARP